VFSWIFSRRRPVWVRPRPAVERYTSTYEGSAGITFQHSSYEALSLHHPCKPINSCQLHQTTSASQDTFLSDASQVNVINITFKPLGQVYLPLNKSSFLTFYSRIPASQAYKYLIFKPQVHAYKYYRMKTHIRSISTFPPKTSQVKPINITPSSPKYKHV